MWAHKLEYIIGTDGVQKVFTYFDSTQNKL